MTDIVLRDIDALLAERIARIAQAHGWTQPQALLHVLERGLHACEGDGAIGLAEQEARVLQAAMTRQVSGEYDEQYRIVRPDGAIRWVRD